MGQRQNYSYLDLAVHAALAPCVLSRDAAVLFNSDLQSILWANAAGAHLFGGKGVVELLDAKISEDQSFVRQLRDSIRQIEDDTPIIRGFRINQGLRSALLQFEIIPVRFRDGNTCYKVVQRAAASDIPPSEHQLATDAVESLVGFADATAIVDDYGLPIAVSSAFGRLGPTDEVLAALVEELSHESDRLIKRPIIGASGRKVVAGLGRIANQPGRNLIVLADAAENIDDLEDGETSVPTLSLLSDEETETSQSESVDEPEENESISVIDEATIDEIEDEVGAEVDAPAEVETPKKEPDRAEETFASLTSIANPVSATPQSSADYSDTIDDAADTEFDEPQDAFSFSAKEDNTRFAWSTDENTTFSTVSDELAETVGPKAADIVGRKWSDISTIFGFDTDGEIARLLSKQDTWSGKTVLWPVEGTDLVVPIDLAALPAFGPERRFDGFRGFGVIRTLDAIVDPEETGLILGGQLGVLSDVEAMNETASEIADVEPSADQNILTPKDETTVQTPSSLLWFETDSEQSSGVSDTDEPDIQLRSDDDQSPDPETTNGNADDASNIVPFVSNNPGAKRLSSRENEAFETIGNTLRTEKDGQTDENAKRDLRRAPDTSLLEELPVAILIYRDTQTLFANKNFLEASGYDNIEAIADAGGIDALLRPPVDVDKQPRDHRLARSNGEFVTINPVLNTVPWDSEKALQLSFVPPAISPVPLPDALEMTQVSEIQSILDTTSDGIILLTREGEIISINASAEALMNKGFDEVTGKHFTELFSKESHTKIIEYLDALSEPGVKSLLHEGQEVIIEEANGGKIPVFLTLAKLESTGKLCAVVQDLTSWKKTEEELVKSRRDAERASEQKSDFLAQVSHEIRTPLNAIIGFSDIMIEERFGVIENKRYREYLNDINRSGKHVLELVNDLLDLSKIESGKLDLTFDAVSLNEIAAEAVTMLQPHANTNRIIVRTSLSRSVPKVVADQRSMRQIVLNLVTNAIKFSEPNSQVIVSTVYESNGEVALRVRDTGNGMTEEEIADALKPYHQLNAVSERTREGTGLGLPLTKALVEANRAFFDLESVPGEGTVAHVQFPVQRVLAD